MIIVLLASPEELELSEEINRGTIFQGLILVEDLSVYTFETNICHTSIFIQAIISSQIQIN